VADWRADWHERGVPTRVTIRGSGFDAAVAKRAAIKCVYDGVRSAPVALSTTAIVCQTPTAKAATVGVAVSSGDARVTPSSVRRLCTAEHPADESDMWMPRFACLWHARTSVNVNSLRD
jgi:hypothetical protein